MNNFIGDTVNRRFAHLSGKTESPFRLKSIAFARSLAASFNLHARQSRGTIIIIKKRTRSCVIRAHQAGVKNRLRSVYVQFNGITPVETNDAHFLDL